MRPLPRQSVTPHAGRRQAGVTLVELLVVLLIVSLVAAGAAQLLAASWNSQETVTGQNEVQRRAQQATDTVVDSLRGAAGVQFGDPSQVTCFFADGSTLTHYLADGELRRDSYDAATGVTTVGDVVCRDVTGLAFGYYRREGIAWVEAVSASLADSLLVSVTASEWKYEATQTSLVKFRNKA
jgi:prepilin-type N-terminal cleavage/methylation domain-containing protein